MLECYRSMQLMVWDMVPNRLSMQVCIMSCRPHVYAHRHMCVFTCAHICPQLEYSILSQMSKQKERLSTSDGLCCFPHQCKLRQGYLLAKESHLTSGNKRKETKTFLTMPWPGLHLLLLPSRDTLIKLRFSDHSLLVLAPSLDPTHVCPYHLPGPSKPEVRSLSQVSGGRQAEAVIGQRCTRAEAQFTKQHLDNWEVELGRLQQEMGALALPLREPHLFFPFQSHQAVKENCRVGEIMKKALCFPPRPNSQLIKPWKCSVQMAVPVLLLIYGNLFKVNCTFPVYPSVHVRELCLPWLRGCLDWGFCLIVSASRSMTF